eukprot:TRINITY_DN39265_c0_g1_i1.p1 TRINITY_DN39265_c0_g1~~TRINITY_DN39265_c0_g1_i1.p1  ORF type:complete len:345 (+),score=69.44 TRINITY_DN39265_c0_g1_i1:54-1088(+)
MLFVVVMLLPWACSGNDQSCTSTGSLQSTFRTAEEDEFRSIVDLERYPIHDMHGPAFQEMLARFQAQWNTTGSISLPGFIREEKRLEMAHEVSGMPAFRRLFTTRYNALLQNNTEVDDKHPSQRLFQTDIYAVAADQISRQTLLRKLYDSPTVAAFLARVLKVPEIYQYDDEFQKLNVMYMHDAGQRSWHYDGSDFVVTVLLQQAAEGGEFEFAPFIRGVAQADGKQDERFDDVRALFDGQYNGSLIKTNEEAGTLSIFNGRRSLHRVRCVYGRVTRISAVLSYDTNHDCAQQAPSLGSNIRNYGERVRESEVWKSSTSIRRAKCKAAGISTPGEFETEAEAVA